MSEVRVGFPGPQGPGSVSVAAIQPGDVVRLRSGGPWMTVQTVEPDQAEAMMTQHTGTPAPPRYATCCWFDAAQGYYTDYFSVAGLVKEVGPADGQPQGEG